MSEPEKQIDKPLTPAPFHPHYGLGDAFRRAVLSYAERTTVHDAADAYRVGVSTVYKWRRRAPHFTSTPAGTNPAHTNGA